MNYAAAAQAAAKKGKSDEPTSVDNATEGSGAKDGGARKSQVLDTLSKVNVNELLMYFYVNYSWVTKMINDTNIIHTISTSSHCHMKKEEVMN